MHLRAGMCAPARENRIVVMQFCLERTMTLDVFSHTNLVQTSTVARVVPAGVQDTDSRLPKLESKLQLPDV